MNQDFLFSRAFKSQETFKELEKDIFKAITKYVKLNVRDIAQFKRVANKGRKTFLREVRLIFKEHNLIFHEVIKNQTKKALRDGIGKTDELISNSKNILEKVGNTNFFVNNSQKQINNTNKDVIKNINKLESSMIRLINKKYSNTVNEIYFNVSKLENNKLFISNLRSETIKSLSKFADKGLPALVDKGGRTLDFVNYAEMKTRQEYKKLFNERQEVRYKENKIDLVVSNVLGDSSTICEPYQGNVYSVGNDKTGKYEEKSVPEGFGLTTHINCRHFWFPYIENVSSIPKQPSKASIAKNRLNRQRQRYNERQIRKWKRRQAVSDTKFNNGKVRHWQKQQRKLVDKNPSMSRDYSREKILNKKITSKPKNNIPISKDQKIYNKLDKNINDMNKANQRDFTKLKSLKKNPLKPESHWSESTNATWKSLPDNFDTSKLKVNYESGGSSISKYWEGKDSGGRFIVRQSDHWGSGIRSTNWYMDGFAKESSWKWKGGTKYGKVYLKDFKDKLFISKQANKKIMQQSLKLIPKKDLPKLLKFQSKLKEINIITNKKEYKFGISRELGSIRDNFSKYLNKNSTFFKKGMKNKDWSEIYNFNFKTIQEVENLENFTMFLSKKGWI